MTTPEPTPRTAAGRAVMPIEATIKGAVTESHMEDDVRVIDGIRVEAVVVRSAQSLLNLLTGASMEAHTAARHPFTYPECEMYPCEQARAALATPPAAPAPEPTTLRECDPPTTHRYDSGRIRRCRRCGKVFPADAAPATPPAAEPTPEQVGQTWERLAALGRAAQPWPATPPAALDVERLANVLRYSPMHWEVRRPDGAFVMTRMFETADDAAAAIAAAYQQEPQP